MTVVLDEMVVPAAVPRRVTSSDKPVRIALVGCGAMSKHNLLPVLSGHTRLTLAALVDRDSERARALAQSYGVAQVMSDIDALSPDVVDAVIIATPPACHAPQTIDLVRTGLHVFVEKPMALTVADANAMVAAADAAGVALGVGFYRRLLPSTRLLRALIDSEMLGHAVSIDVEEGGEYGWQLATLANLTRHLGGGGVLIDIGSHVIDQLQLILPGGMDVCGYSDNSKGGVETEAILDLMIHGPSRRVPCRIELSRTREMRNSLRVRCERGTLELRRGEFARVGVRPDDLEVRDPLAGVRVADVSAQWGDEAPLNGYQAFRAEIDDWLDAMMLGRDPVLSGRSVLPTVRIVEDAYQRRTRLAEPWNDEGIRVRRRTSPRQRRVLITGASGFIGCRTAEILSRRDGWDVRALVHNPSHAARLASLSVDMCAGDVCAPESLTRALDGCDAVVHCAVGTSWKRDEVIDTTVNGTRNVAAAARCAGIARFVHISSMAVYAADGLRALDESAPLVADTAHNYGSDKRRAEDAVRREIAEGLQATILRPTRVYGPFGKTFTVRPLQHLASSRLVLAGPVDAPANMVFVDNVVEAIACALDADSSVVGQAFNVSDPDQLSWREFYGFFAQALDTELRIAESGAGSVRPVNHRHVGWLSRVGSGVSEILGSTEFRGFGRKCLETDPIGTLPRWAWERFPAVRRRIQTIVKMDDAVIYRPPAADRPADMVFHSEPGVVTIDKAREALAYEPIVDRERAMALTLEWIKYSRLLGAAS